MTKFKHLLILTIILISNLGCESKPKEKTNIKTKREKNEENSIKFDFFPSDAGTKVGDIITVDSSAFHNTTRIYLERKISKIEIDKIKRFNYIYHINSDDNCLVVINDFLNESNFHTRLSSQKSIVNKSCNGKKIPIPNFWSIKEPSNETKSHLKSNSEIYIFKLDIGLLSSKINPKISSMPKEIKHGVVGGIILNMQDTSAIYFVQYW